MRSDVGSVGRTRAVWCVGVGVLAMSVGCTADKTTIPALTGPSTLGTSVRLLLSRDALYADGLSSTVVTVQVFDSNGKSAANRLVYLLTGNEKAQPLNIGQLSVSQVVTGADGSATAVYTAPAAKNFSANQVVTVLARVAMANGSSQAQVWESARIELMAIEQRTWPEGTSHPTCAMMTDPRYGPWYTGRPISFTTRSTAGADTYIIQYLWRFGDDETKYYYGPDQVHTFTAPGDYQIFQSVLDNNGAVDSCLFVHDGDPFMTVQNP